MMSILNKNKNLAKPLFSVKGSGNIKILIIFYVGFRYIVLFNFIGSFFFLVLDLFVLFNYFFVFK